MSAKIAASPRNKAGLIYLSWKDGIGYMIHLWRDPHSGLYGLRQLELPDEASGHWAYVQDDVKPSLIDKHGTMVVPASRNFQTRSAGNLAAHRLGRNQHPGLPKDAPRRQIIALTDLKDSLAVHNLRSAGQPYQHAPRLASRGPYRLDQARNSRIGEHERIVLRLGGSMAESGSM